MIAWQDIPARWSSYQPMENTVQFRASVVNILAGLSHSPAWLLVSLVIVLSCRGLPADAVEVAAPKWMKVCGGPDSDPFCTTMAQLEQTMTVQLLEPVRDPSIRKLRVLVGITDPAKAPSLKDTIRISVDSKRFLEMPIVICNTAYCGAEKQLSDGDLAMLAGANSLEIDAPGKSVNAPMGNFAAIRAGKGMTEAEYQAEMARLQEELQKKLERAIEDQKEKLKNGGRTFLTDAPAARPQEGFCAALKGVMAAAQGDFKSIRGEPVYGGFVPRISIPGSGECDIDPLGYWCKTSFKLREVADKQMTSLAQSVGKCLPNVKAERSKSDDGFPTIEFDNKTSTVDITLSKPIEKHIDAYDVTLTVSHY
jgi:invasion protein IalB